MKNLLSVKQTAERLGGLSTWTIHAWFKTGKLRRTKVGARSMVSELDLQAFLDECNPQSPIPALDGTNPVPVSGRK
jgi:hypothetical protein